ncbi:MAG: sulfur carrier protein ThiS [Sulfurimonas sp.]|jgi:sulfur carrier protein|uniref:sulfur carrier protein ThiS n=1 Tax=Sulfurimonas sp. TaxID=2022749 RepID=UPI00261D1946|nr:sulfur carrier protein ThiS [Sulfurimonas sp.]MDD3475981.1 sulfur carrier protein ThiS [Sulfurimonas sp.]HUH42835.1 sulfur carrier protein ThiS [Sulfurimonas sp.]
MKLVINGEIKEFEEKITLEKLLDALELKDKVMAAAVNMEIVKQHSWDSHQLCDMDKVELLDFVGGG